jgi:hypothetical protein
MIKLTCIGTDGWSRPVYEDEDGRIWKDVNLGSGEPYLHRVCNDDFEGEPDMPLTGEYKIIKANKPVDEAMRFNHMMLSRMKGDCEYFLGHGNGSLIILTPKDRIEEMKKLWNAFSDYGKPERLTWEQILKYEKDMLGEKGFPR